MYDLDRFDGYVIMTVIRAHPKVLMNGLVVENPPVVVSVALAGRVPGDPSTW